MRNRAAVIGAGVSGLTCGVVFAERGWDVTIFADETGQKTTSGAAAAVWFPYDAEPADKVIPWSLITYERLRELARDSRSGVSMLEIWQFTRVGQIPIPDWAKNLGARPISVIPSEVAGSLRIPAFPSIFSNGYALNVPLIDTTIYLDYLANRFHNAGGTIELAHINKVEEISRDFDVIVNCAGIGARELARDFRRSNWCRRKRNRAFAEWRTSMGHRRRQSPAPDRASAQSRPDRGGVPIPNREPVRVRRCRRN